jgi:hypothetical protein
VSASYQTDATKASPVTAVTGLTASGQGRAAFGYAYQPLYYVSAVYVPGGNAKTCRIWGEIWLRIGSGPIGTPLYQLDATTNPIMSFIAIRAV